jgi:hypothetical protein
MHLLFLSTILAPPLPVIQQESIASNIIPGFKWNADLQINNHFAGNFFIFG